MDFDLPVIAVAGSNGKTTTKELLSSVLRQKCPTLSSQASFNNDIGVPTTLLALTRAHRAAVLEFGTNHPGELAPLLRLAKPHLGVLTSIGREHLEYFGDLEGVVQEEGWLAELLPANGRLFVNGDGPHLEAIVRRCPAPVVRVGFAQDNDWRATKPQMDETGLSFQVEAPVAGFSRPFRVRLLGRHQVVNALLAVAVGAAFGLSPLEVERGLMECAPARMRLQFWKAQGVGVLDDSYNANADSMRAAIQTLCDLPCAGRRVAVLGDMAELGVHAPGAHAEVGRFLGQMGIQHLLTVGKLAKTIAQVARESGLKEVADYDEVAAAAQALRSYLRPGDVVLLKASRATGLERIGAVLRQPALTGLKP
jgi:UDP-N-acetylmuramoyl-tripeptide--D-alanyl-D-alanine ligase